MRRKYNKNITKFVRSFPKNIFNYHNIKGIKLITIR